MSLQLFINNISYKFEQQCILWKTTRRKKKKLLFLFNKKLCLHCFSDTISSLVFAKALFSWFKKEGYVFRRDNGTFFEEKKYQWLLRKVIMAFLSPLHEKNLEIYTNCYIYTASKVQSSCAVTATDKSNKKNVWIDLCKNVYVIVFKYLVLSTTPLWYFPLSLYSLTWIYFYIKLSCFFNIFVIFGPQRTHVWRQRRSSNRSFFSVLPTL